MTGVIKEFLASEAFAYVDTYRNSILKSASALNSEKERLNNKFWESSTVDLRYYAELRAVEHALDYVLKGTDPGTVILGEPAAEAEGEGAPAAEELEECRQTLQELGQEKGKLDKSYRQLVGQAQQLQAQLVQQRQEANALKRRLTQNNSTFVVIAMTMFTVILTLLWVLSGR